MMVRLTLATRLVLDLLLEVPSTAPLWGYVIIIETDLGPGTVYPILKRLEEAGWVEGTWETARPIDRPRRCTYAVTEQGAREYAEAMARRKRGAYRRP